MTEQTVNQEELVSFLASMVKCKSENPPGSTAECADILTKLLDSEGIPYELKESIPGVVNVVARLRGKGFRSKKAGGGRAEKTLLFNGHLDTIPAGKGWSVDPFGGEISEGFMFGRGTTDMKAGLTASLFAVVEAARRGANFEGEIIFTAVGDEEFHGKHGTKYLLAEGLQADCAVNCEPTNLDISLGNRGLVMVDVVVKGKSSHGGRPGLGKNAIHIGTEIIQELKKLDFESSRNDRFKDPVGSLSVVGFHGGDRINVIPDECTFNIDRRLMPGEIAEDAVAQIAEVVREVTGQAPDINTDGNSCTRLITEVFHQPFWLDVQDPYVRTCVDAYRRCFSREPEFEGKSAGTDASHLVSMGQIPTIIFGPGDYRGSHTIDERVELAQLEPAKRFYVELIDTILAGEGKDG